MLDQDSVLEPHSAGKAVKVEGSVRHISQEDLEAYSTGRLATGRVSYCQTHLDSCDACRAELEDIRTLQTELSTFTRPAEASRRKPQRLGRRRSLAVPLTATAAVVLVAGGVTMLWSRHGSGRVHNTSAATLVARPAPPAARVAAPPARPTTPAVTAKPTSQPHNTRLAEEISALPDDLRPSVSDAIQQGKIQLPADVPRIHDRAPSASASSEANKGFSLSGPFGEATSDTRPRFTWQPLAGAIGYTVAIVDQSLRPVQHSPGLRATSWRPRRALTQGHTYLWQVTATLHGGTKVVASSPSPSEAVLRVIPRKLADQMTHFQRGHQEAHLVLGVLYAQAGMLTDGTNELRKVQPDDPSYNVARRLLQSLTSGK